MDEVSRVINCAQTALNRHTNFIPQGVTEVDGFILLRRNSSLAIIWDAWKSTSRWREDFHDRLFTAMVLDGPDPSKFGRIVVRGHVTDAHYSINEYVASTEALKSWRRPVLPTRGKVLKRPPVQLIGAVTALYIGGEYNADDELSLRARSFVHHFRECLYHFPELESHGDVHALLVTPDGVEAICTKHGEAERENYTIFTPREEPAHV